MKLGWSQLNLLTLNNLKVRVCHDEHLKKFNFTVNTKTGMGAQYSVIEMRMAMKVEYSSTPG